MVAKSKSEGSIASRKVLVVLLPFSWAICRTLISPGKHPECVRQFRLKLKPPLRTLCFSAFPSPSQILPPGLRANNSNNPFQASRTLEPSFASNMNQFQASANQGGPFSPSANNLPLQHATYIATQNSSTDSSDGSPKEHAADSKSGLTRLGDFWKRYDRLADSHDRKMSQNLNGNLDVLLIFVSTVFIL